MIFIKKINIESNIEIKMRSRALIHASFQLLDLGRRKQYPVADLFNAR